MISHTSESRRTSAFAPFFDPNAVKKISMKGNPVFDWVAATMSWMLNKTAIIIEKPSVPLNRVENQMLKGMTLEAWLISSAVNINLLVRVVILILMKFSRSKRNTYQYDLHHHCPQRN